MITGVFNSRLDLGQFFGLIRKKISKSKDGSILKSREGAKARSGYLMASQIGAY